MLVELSSRGRVLIQGIEAHMRLQAVTGAEYTDLKLAKTGV